MQNGFLQIFYNSFMIQFSTKKLGGWWWWFKNRSVCYANACFRLARAQQSDSTFLMLENWYNNIWLLRLRQKFLEEWITRKSPQRLQSLLSFETLRFPFSISCMCWQKLNKHPIVIKCHPFQDWVILVSRVGWHWARALAICGAQTALGSREDPTQVTVGGTSVELGHRRAR